MNRDVVITCAVTGSGATHDKHPDLPKTPAQIADSAIEAAKAGAAIVHIHVREDDGTPCRDPDKFAEVCERIRASGVDVVLNLTAGMGGDLTLGPPDDPMRIDETATDMASASERLEHVRRAMPEICTLDCGTMNFGHGDYVMTNTTSMLFALAKEIQALGVKPEIEAFDTGHIVQAQELIDAGLIDAPPLFQLCLGIPYGAPATPTAMKAMAEMLPAGANWSGFGISRQQMPMVAQAALLGGNVRVGLEDNLYLERGVFASNADLVARARQILELMGARVLSPDEARAKFALAKRH
ncbi:MAG: 3-keto-5-aminohexanoate cleavage protein [Alphaproteobacteria bacterium]|nr:3-keto-5-aminohexanoate cleavage protein [Alphaproteobacteria bacterium]